jgi:outer membrane autotransporter protein
VVVNNGATFSGNVSVLNGNFMTNAGTVKPGNSIGTINVTGGYTQTANGTLSIELDALGNSSLLNVTGAAVINGTAAFTFNAGSYPDQISYTFVQAGSVAGTFSGTTFSNIPANLRLVSSNIIYNPTNIQLQLTFSPLFVLLGVLGNAQNTANYLDCVANSTLGTTDMQNVLQQLDALSFSSLQKALDSIAPTMLAGFALIEQETAVATRNAISHRTTLIHTTQCPTDQTDKEGLCFWTDLSQAYSHQGRLHDQAGYQTTSRGVVLGLDYLVTDHAAVGIAGSYSHSHVHWRDHAGHGNIHNFYGGAYATYFGRRAYFDLSLLGGASEYKSTRYLEFAAINRRAKAKHSGSELAASAAAGLTFRPTIQRRYSETKQTVSESAVISPFVSLDYIYLHENGFREHDAGSLNAKVSNKNAELLRSEVGVKFTYCDLYEQGKCIPELKLSYVRESRFGGKNYHSTLDGGINTDCPAFTTETRRPDRNLFNPEVGVNVSVLDDLLDISAYYEAEIGSHYFQQEGRLHFEFRF